MSRQTLITVAALYTMALAGVVTIKVFFDPVPIPTGTESAFGALVGAFGLAGLVELVKARRRKDD